MKLKQIFLEILLLLLSIVYFQCMANADTEVGREITTNTTWTLAGSPYIVTQNIIVNAGVTLTIEPGVIVKLNPKLGMIIEGKLIARGTKDNMITFTSNSSSLWGIIQLNQSSPVATFDATGNYLDGSILEYCIGEYSSKGPFWGYDTSPFINYCVVRNCTQGLIRIDNGNYPTTGYKHPELKITRITNNSVDTGDSAGGIYMVGDNSYCGYNTVKGSFCSIGGVGNKLTITYNKMEGGAGITFSGFFNSPDSNSVKAADIDITYNTITNAIG